MIDPNTPSGNQANPLYEGLVRLHEDASRKVIEAAGITMPEFDAEAMINLPQTLVGGHLLDQLNFDEGKFVLVLQEPIMGANALRPIASDTPAEIMNQIANTKAMDEQELSIRSIESGYKVVTVELLGLNAATESSSEKMPSPGELIPRKSYARIYTAAPETNIPTFAVHEPDITVAGHILGDNLHDLTAALAVSEVLNESHVQILSPAQQREILTGLQLAEPHCPVDDSEV